MQNKNAAKADSNFIRAMHNISGTNLLPEGCQFLMPDCSAISGRYSNTPLTGWLPVFFGVPREHPAKIRKSVEITQNLWIEIFFSSAECGDMPLRAAACCASKIQCRRNRRLTGHKPVFGI